MKHATPQHESKAIFRSYENDTKMTWCKIQQNKNTRSRVFPHKEKKTKNLIPNKWRTINSWVHGIQKEGTGEILLARKIKASTAERRWRNPV